MLFLAALSAVAVTAAKLEWETTPPPSHLADYNVARSPEITVVEANKTYAVSLECVGCPFAVKKTNSSASWKQIPQTNALQLHFTIATSEDQEQTLLLNGHRVLPLGPMPLNIKAQQIIAVEERQQGFLSHTIKGLEFPLQYEHSIIRTKEEGQLWIQFDVTGLPLGELNDPIIPSLNAELVKLDKEGQKLVQILLRNDSNALLIEDVQMVTRKDRAQPYRMKCGRLAMVQTAFDPTEWDEYGKLGTESRFMNLLTSKMSEFWDCDIQHNPFMIPLALLLACGIFMARHWYQRRGQENFDLEGDAQVALLGVEFEYEDTPPAYADSWRSNIPLIKIEEYD